MAITRRSALIQTVLGGLIGTSLRPTVAWAETESYQYDVAGRLILVERGDGTTTTYTYDAGGNRTQVTTATPPAVPTFISAGAGADNSGASSLSVPYPSGLQAGNAIYLHVAVSSASGYTPPSITTPSGFTLVQSGDSHNSFDLDLGWPIGIITINYGLGMSVYKRTASGSESSSVSLSFSATSGSAVARMYRFLGGVSAEGGAAAGVQSGGPTTTLPVPNVTTTGPNRRVLQFMAAAGNVSFSAPSPYNPPISAYSSDYGSIGIADATQTSAGTISSGNGSVSGAVWLAGSVGAAAYG